MNNSQKIFPVWLCVTNEIYISNKYAALPSGATQSAVPKQSTFDIRVIIKEVSGGMEIFTRCFELIIETVMHLHDLIWQKKDTCFIIHHDNRSALHWNSPTRSFHEAGTLIAQHDRKSHTENCNVLLLQRRSVWPDLNRIWYFIFKPSTSRIKWIDGDILLKSYFTFYLLLIVRGFTIYIKIFVVYAKYLISSYLHSSLNRIHRKV